MARRQRRDLSVFESSCHLPICLPHTMEASHCPFNCWTSSREAVNTNFYSLWFDSTGNRTRVYKVTHLGEDEVFTAADVATAIKGIKSGKAAGEDEIRPEMLKALTGEGILWLTRVCQVAWKFGKTTRDWQTGVIIPIFKKGDRKQCTNYSGISLLSLPRKVYAKCLERKCREIVESKLEDGQCGFRPGRSITDQIFTLKQIFEKSWEYGKDLFECFVDLEKAYDRVPRDKLWKVLQL